MQLVIHPIQDPERELDLTHRLVSAIADELWKLYGGNDHLNWIEAELHLQRLVGEARAVARETQLAKVAPSRAPATGTETHSEPLGRPDRGEQLEPSRSTQRRAQPARRSAAGPGTHRAAPERREQARAAPLRRW